MTPARRQRAAIAVETALALPILLGVGMIGTDIQRIHTERIRLENAAGTMALNLAAQPELTTAGLDALADAAMQGRTGSQQLIVLNVLQSGRVSWAVRRGGAQGLCDAPVAAGRYAGALPEDPPETGGSGSGSNAADADTSTLSMVVVKACRDTGDVALFGGLAMPGVLETAGIFRAAARTIALDDKLQAESDATGLAFTAASQ